jgi:hypothetical protein
MAMIRMRVRKKKLPKPIMDQRRMLRTDGIVLECEDWTVYIRRVKYDKGGANATASNVSEA